MRLALLQAHKNLGNTKENPSVGCVITKKNLVINASCTSINGRPHAEQNAISTSRFSLKGCNLYVTLEPCSHYGKTAPCTKSIIKKKFRNVIFSIIDPDIRSHNRSEKILKRKKINVIKGVCLNESNNFYRSYIKYKKKPLPFVTAKLAISKDYYTINKKKKWITNKFSRGRVHLIRSSHDCIVTSSKTIIEDNPRLTCRIDGLFDRSPSRIILDKRFSIPLSSNIIKDASKRRTIIFYNKKNISKIKYLKRLKIKTFHIPLNKQGDLDLIKVLIKIKKLGFYRILVEAGIKLTSNFLKENLVDDFKLFISNNNLGKQGDGNIRYYYKVFFKNKSYKNEKVNLFGDKLLSYKIK